MTRKWVSRSTGPDWVDVRSAMKGLEETHHCQSYLHISPGSTPYGPELRVVLTCVSNGPGRNLRACEESVAVNWPHGWSDDMPSTVFALIYRMEAELTRKWWEGESYKLP